MTKRKLMPVMTIQQSESTEVKRLKQVLSILFFILKCPFLLVYYIRQFAEFIIDKLEDVQAHFPYSYIKITKLPKNGKRG